MGHSVITVPPARAKSCLNALRRRAVQAFERWRAGYDDLRTVLNEPNLLDLPDPVEAIRLFNVRHGCVNTSSKSGDL